VLSALQALFAQGEAQINAQQGAYAAGINSALALLGVYASAVNGLIGSLGAYARGQNETADSVPLYARGTNTGSGALSAFAYGIIQSVGSVFAFAYAQAAQLAALSGYARGSNSGIASQSVYAYGVNVFILGEVYEIAADPEYAPVQDNAYIVAQEDISVVPAQSAFRIDPLRVYQAGVMSVENRQRLDHDVNAVDTFTIDWSQYLDDAVTISSITWDIPPDSGMTEDAKTLSGKLTQIKISGGTPSIIYWRVTCHATTSIGVRDASLLIRCVQK